MKSSFFHINPENLTTLFNLIDYLILTLNLKPNLNRKPQIECAQMNIAHCSFIYLGYNTMVAGFTSGMSRNP